MYFSLVRLNISNIDTLYDTQRGDVKKRTT